MSKTAGKVHFRINVYYASNKTIHSRIGSKYSTFTSAERSRKARQREFGRNYLTTLAAYRGVKYICEETPQQ